MTICFCIVAAVIISALTVGFADQIIEFCGSSEDTHAMAARYYRIIMGGMIFNVLSMGINAAQRGAGNTMIALRTNLIDVYKRQDIQDVREMINNTKVMQRSDLPFICLLYTSRCV